MLDAVANANANAITQPKWTYNGNKKPTQIEANNLQPQINPNEVMTASWQ